MCPPKDDERAALCGWSTAGLRAVVDLVQSHFRRSITLPFVEDVAFIGNTSALYPWDPTLFLDIDICVFVSALDQTAGAWLARVRDRLKHTLQKRGVDFELRVVRGPYKPAHISPTRPVALAHLAVFTDATYRAHGNLLRYGWRKYPCLVETNHLARLCPSRPTLHDLLAGERGVLERLRAIESGCVRMQEHLLPSFELKELVFDHKHLVFTEYCLSAPATCARNHARVLGYKEADSLPNVLFFPWYESHVVNSKPLRELMRLKESARLYGYAGISSKARDLALAYLFSLVSELEQTC